VPESSRHGSVFTELTEPQRRHLLVFLDHVEAAAAEVARLGGLPPAERTLTIDEADLPAGFGDRVRPEVTRLRRDIETLAARFGLGTERRSRLHRVQALLVAAAVQVEDAGSRALRAYGPLECDLPQQLDTVLDDIADALGAMLSALVPPGTGREREAGGPERLEDI
jgi:hypothetical protein